MKKQLFIPIIFSFVSVVLFVNVSLAQSCPSQTQYSSNYATLVGAVSSTGGDSNIQVWFDWGLTNSFGNSTPVQNFYVSSVPYHFCSTITNLQPCTTYYYRAVIRNSMGTNYGATYSFTTRCTSVNNPLTISCYANPNPANINSSVNFNSVVTGGTGNYTYSWSGACSGFSSSCSNSFSSPGVYSANLTVTSGLETRTAVCSVNVVSPNIVSIATTTPVTININQQPVPIIAFTPRYIRPGTIVTFDASRSYDPDGSIVSYRWEINGRVVSDSKSFRRSLASGSYQIKLTVTDNKNMQSSKEILINVGRTTYITRQQIATRNIPTTVRVTSAKLVNALFENSYRVNICATNEIPFTIVNNTSVNRKITIKAQGENADWFSPQEKTFVLKPFETLLAKWSVNVPCDISAKNYEINFLATTPGGNYQFSTVFEAVKQKGDFSPLLGFIGLFGIFNPIWLLILLLILINAYLWYRVFRKKEESKIITKDQLL
jgi:uncharacterized membrane protein